MRLTSQILCSTSVIAFMIAATPAAAQQTDPATPPDPTVEAQEQPADPEAGSAQTDDAVQTTTGADQTPSEDPDTIVVTGLRRSLQSSQNIKRNSEQIVDAIVAEDIGKLPDVAVSDTAARIPGVQVERGGGEAGRVLVRGLPDYTTTYNGREIFTAETRTVALQDFPAGGIGAIEVFKSSTANLVEPGLAGLVNVRSRRPFDFKDFEVAGSVWGLYPNQSRDFKPNFNLLATDRWSVGEGEMGALLNVSYTRLHYQDSIRRHGYFVAPYAGGRSPDWPEIAYGEGDRWRPSVNGALQWRPNPDVELYAEGLWQGFRHEISDRMWSQPIWGGNQSDLEFRNGDETDLLVSGTVQNPGCGDCTWGFQGATTGNTNTYQFAVGGRWDAGPLRITGDIARTDSTFRGSTASFDWQLNTNQYTVDFDIGTPNGNGPTFEVSGIDPTDIDNFEYRGFYEEAQQAKGDDWQARLDFEYEPGLDFVPKLQWGARFVDRNAERFFGNRYWNFGGRHIPLADLPLEFHTFNPAFRGDDDRPYPRTWVVPTYASIRDNLRDLRLFNMALGGTQFGVNSDDAPPANPETVFNINEQSVAAYGQANFKFEGAVPIDGTIGLRVVSTKDDIQGQSFTVGSPGDPEPVDFENEYTDILPNANLRARLTDQLQLRLAATKTRTRPSFTELNPGLRLNSPPGACPPEQPTCLQQRTGTGGNPFLDPLKSNNYDASLEYYFSRTGFAALALFRRDMRGFIANVPFEYPDPDPDTGLPLIITAPVNTRESRIQGFEAQVSTFFDWDFMPNWARGFGAQANLTHLDTWAEFGEDRRSLAFVSRWSYNLVGMYERGGFTARLAYNWRSRYRVGEPEFRGGDFSTDGRPYSMTTNALPVSRLDWSSSYTVFDNLTVFFDWTNILGKPYRENMTRVVEDGDTTVFPRGFRFEESIKSGGIRFRF